MRRAKWTVVTGLVGWSVIVGAPAGADMTGSWDGGVTGKKLPAAVAAAAVLSETSKNVNGTVALSADLAGLSGEYLVVGKATPKRLKVSGTGPGGARLKWRAKIVGDTLAGKALVKAPGSKLAGTLAMTRNPPPGDGSGCDGVYALNQTFFDDQVLGQALAACSSCHAPGLQAGATRFQVTPNDGLATARAVAVFVDAANPSASRILEKPLNLVPHGGGAQLDPGSTEAQALEQWVALVAAAQCN